VYFFNAKHPSQKAAECFRTFPHNHLHNDPPQINQLFMIKAIPNMMSISDKITSKNFCGMHQASTIPKAMAGIIKQIFGTRLFTK